MKKKKKNRIEGTNEPENEFYALLHYYTCHFLPFVYSMSEIYLSSYCNLNLLNFIKNSIIIIELYTYY